MKLKDVRQAIKKAQKVSGTKNPFIQIVTENDEVERGLFDYLIKVGSGYVLKVNYRDKKEWTKIKIEDVLILRAMLYPELAELIYDLGNGLKELQKRFNEI